MRPMAMACSLPGGVTMNGPVTINVNGFSNGISMSAGQLVLRNSGLQSQIHGDIGPAFKMTDGVATLNNNRYGAERRHICGRGRYDGFAVENPEHQWRFH